MLDGQLAWRQHDGGHTDAPNWKYFIPWADKFFDHHPAAWELPADQPVFRRDANSLVAHSQLLAKAKQSGIDVYFEGDSITRRWGALDYPDLLANWKQNFFGWNAADFGWGADRTQNILWRLENGELDGVNPKVVVLLAGTNNVGDFSAPGDVHARADDITRGLQAIVHVIQEKAPAATIVVMGIFPRNDNMAFMPVIDSINRDLSKFADGRKIRYLNINDKLADGNGKLFDGMMNAKDKLHPTVKAISSLGRCAEVRSLRSCWGLPRRWITPHRQRATRPPDTDRAASPFRVLAILIGESGDRRNVHSLVLACGKLKSDD